ncbi:molybdopterin cofactor-binding domain-containing protein [Nonomuraea insulae]|uniref:Molybdopterin cofactor-binding domain-containing protein n=1 Tax=Nonomuraea insulae TaxID=1616787 RepID=A0ABW1CSI1_9ACTN
MAALRRDPHGRHVHRPHRHAHRQAQPAVLGVYDAGRIINPRLAETQAIGGLGGGIGMAPLEHTITDPATVASSTPTWPTTSFSPTPTCPTWPPSTSTAKTAKRTPAAEIGGGVQADVHLVGAPGGGIDLPLAQQKLHSATVRVGLRSWRVRSGPDPGLLSQPREVSLCRNAVSRAPVGSAAHCLTQKSRCSG